MILMAGDTGCFYSTEELELTFWKVSENVVNLTLSGTNTCIHSGYIYTSKLIRNILWH